MCNILFDKCEIGRDLSLTNCIWVYGYREAIVIDCPSVFDCLLDCRSFTAALFAMAFLI